MNTSFWKTFLIAAMLGLGSQACFPERPPAEIIEKPVPSPPIQVDDDDDGFPIGVDCDDSDPDINPDAEEVCDGIDNDCQNGADDGFPDLDEDRIADCVDEDMDGDAYGNPVDNCPNINNPDQADSDNDDVGDVCDTCTDLDGDGWGLAGTDQSECSNTGDDCDDSLDSVSDRDGDNLCDDSDEDDDGDGILDVDDACPNGETGWESTTNTDVDTDGCKDTVEDICFYGPDNIDTDNDGTPDGCDDCPTGDDCSVSPPTTDAGVPDDGLDGGEMAPDQDNDGIPDAEDDCPADADNDLDNDGICGNNDPCPADANNDADNDGICGDVDTCPADPYNDVDADGLCADVDPCPADPENDADNDGVCGDVDICSIGDDNVDSDNDNVPDACDYCANCSLCENNYGFLADSGFDFDENGIPWACEESIEVRLLLGTVDEAAQTFPLLIQTNQNIKGVQLKFIGLGIAHGREGLAEQADWNVNTSESGDLLMFGIGGETINANTDYENLTVLQYTNTEPLEEICIGVGTSNGSIGTNDHPKVIGEDDGFIEVVFGNIDLASRIDTTNKVVCWDVDDLTTDLGTTPTDTDNDGIADEDDACPTDPDNDIDNDGLCADDDPCPTDVYNDLDNDGICGNLDACPADPDNDLDDDGICGNEDMCPIGDDSLDEDGDTIPDACDLCKSCEICGETYGALFDSGFDFDENDVPWACEETIDVQIKLGAINTVEKTLPILIQSNQILKAVQIKLPGLSTTGGSGGLADSAGWTLSAAQSGFVMMFGMFGEEVAANSEFETLTVLSYNNTEAIDQVCVDTSVGTGSSGKNDHPMIVDVNGVLLEVVFANIDLAASIDVENDVVCWDIATLQ